MATPAQSSVPNTTLTDPFVFAIYQIHQQAFDSAQKMVTDFYPAWEASAKRLNEFQVQLRDRANDLQHKEAVVPPLLELAQEQQRYLVEYWSLKQIPEQLGQAGESIRLTIRSLSRRPYPRIYAEVQRVKNDQPVLFAQIERMGELCREMIADLRTTWSKTATLRDSMVTVFQNDLDYSLQRFCQIVDNQGKPVSTATLFFSGAHDLVYSPVIPKPIAQSPGELWDGVVII